METDFRGYNTEEVSRLIDLWIFSKKKREMLKAYLIDAETIERIAEMYEYSPRNTSTIINEGKNIVFSHMNKNHNVCVVMLRKRKPFPTK